MKRSQQQVDDSSDSDYILGYRKSEELRRTCLKQLEDSIRLIPQNADYLMAKRRATSTDVFEAESDPFRFLVCEDLNCFAAARRLATYWHQRRAMFGEERAFLPMNLTGEGALGEEDIAFFDDNNNPRPCILPNDRYERSVAFVDMMSRGTTVLSNNARALFFLWQVLAANEKSQTTGPRIIFLVNGTEAVFGGSSHPVFANQMLILRDAMPMKPPLCHIIVCISPTEGKKRSSLEPVVPMVLKGLFGNTLSEHLVDVDIVDSAEQAVVELEQVGFRKKDLPILLGGTLDDDSVVLHWHKGRGRATAGVASKMRPTGGASKMRYSSNLVPGALEKEFSAARMVDDAGRPSGIQTGTTTATADRKRKSHEIISVGILHGSESSQLDAFAPFWNCFTNPPPAATFASSESNNTAREQVLLREALDLIPKEEKSAYMEALQRAPHLVQNESNPHRYLKLYSHDPWLAAKRLTRYWKARREVFGHDRAFLPMNLSGEGAMSREDVAIFRLGSLQLLPSDSKGRVVFYHDRSRLSYQASMETDSRVRCLFYVFSLLLTTEALHSKGIVVITSFVDKAASPFHEMLLARRLLNLLATGALIPFDVKGALHIIWPARKNSVVDALVPAFNLILQARKVPGRRVVFRVHKMSPGLVGELESIGLRRDHLPPSVGGTWGDDAFVRWQMEQRAAIKAVSDPLLQRVPVASRARSKKIQVKMQSRGGRGGSEGGRGERMEEWRERKRKSDALSARRRRARIKIEVEVLKEQCAKMTTKNASLKEDNERLERMFRAAREQISQIDACEP